jgi:PAT family beta-lactamase induction signal transducer AmpG
MRTAPRPAAGVLGLLATLYLAQGLPYGFLTQAVPVLLRQEGASLTAISGARLLLAPWLLKVLWAPVVDRWWSARMGRRRSWIVPLQLLSVALFLGLAAVPVDDVIGLLLAVTLVTAFIAATQDIATDGLAVSLLPPGARGLGNGLQVAGYRLGMVLGGGGVLLVLASAGWAASWLAMAGLLALSSVPVLLWREPADTAPPSVTGPPWAAVRAAVAAPGAWRWLALLVAYKLGEQAGGSVVKPLLVDLGMDLASIGWLGGADSAVSLLGALVGGVASSRIGRRRALVGFGLVQAALVGAWACPAWTGSASAAVAVTLVDGFVGSMATATLFAAMMDRCAMSDEALADAGTAYTVQASVVLVAGFVGGGLAGPVADALAGPGDGDGYARFFLGAAVLTALGALAMARWAPRDLPDGG